ncbi:MAG: hypothetical protein E7563_07690 [Ruminococcaceae bacterium]|nr:hypothetical protein [Oscillospiraceae bacterium]
MLIICYSAVLVDIHCFQNVLRGLVSMANEKVKSQDYYVIDFVHIVKSVWRRIWLVVLVAVIGGFGGFFWSSFFITPQYSSSVMLYVNNSSFSLGSSSFSISSSELTAAQSLVKTYTVILKNRTTLNQVIEKSGVDYTYEELYGMIKADSVNETEVLKVTVTTDDPYIATDIVNTIAEVLPDRISDIIEGSSMEVVDIGVVNTHKVSPNITKYTKVGLLLGAIAALVVLVIFALLDDTIHDDEYILRTYDYPILAKVPNLLGTSDKKYAYYYQRKKNVK